MSLRHWEAVRDRLRDELDGSLMTAGALPEEKDRLAGVLATSAIEAYAASVNPRPQRSRTWLAP